MPEGSGGSRGIGTADLALLIFLGVLWGTAFLFITTGLQSFTPILLVALRFDISGSVLLAIALARKRGSLVPRGRPQWAAVVFAAVFNVTGYHALLFSAQVNTDAGIAAIIVGMNPVLTTAFSRAFLKDERVGAGGLLGIGVGMAGIVLLATLKGGDLLDIRGVSELLIVGAIASWSFGSVLVRRTGHRMDLFTFIAWQSLAGAGILHFASLVLEGGGHATFDSNGVVSLLYLAIISSALGFAIYFTLLSRIGPIRLNFVSQIAAAVAAVGGVLFFRENPGLRGAGAFALIAAGLVLVTRRQILRTRGARETPRPGGGDPP